MKSKQILWLSAGALFFGCLASPLRAAGLELEQRGVGVTVEGAGKYLFSYPQLLGEGEKPAGKLIEARVEGSKAKLKYDDKTEAEVSLEKDRFLIRFIHPANSVKRFKVEASLGFSSLFSAQWRVGKEAFQAFPEQKPPRPHLLQGGAGNFDFLYSMGNGLTVELPTPNFLQLTDCREWEWKNFSLVCFVPLDRKAQVYVFAFRETAANADAPKQFLIDRFGQYMQKDWPAKVKSEEELRADVAADEEYYAGFQPPQFDRYGGLPGSKEKLGFKQTGFFHLEQKEGRWYLVDPEGNWFFHLGVCSFGPYTNSTYYEGRENVYEWIPEFSGEFRTAFGQNGGGNADGQFNYLLANRIRKYGKPYDAKEFTAQMIERVRKFGFNSTGAFGSGHGEAREEAGFPYVMSLPLAPGMGIAFFSGIRDLWDPFDEKTRAAVEDKLRVLAERADDPLLIGYFLANEPLYEDLPKILAALNEKSACKRRLVEMLEAKYKTIAAFNRAWNASLASFQDAEKQGLPLKTQAAANDMEDFKNLFLEEYFKFVTGLVRKYAPNHLILGCRFQSGTINSENLCRIGGKYVDIWSFNYYTYGIDEEFLKKIYAWTGKPMILSEFYWNSFADSGVSGGVKDVSSQEERGLAYRNYVEHAATLPFVVGVEWFTLLDASQTGVGFAKYNGENPNSGLISVADRPWKPMIAEMVKTNYDIYKVAAGENARFVYDDPKFSTGGVGRNSVTASRVTAPLKIDGQGGDWPGMPAEGIGSNRLVHGKDAKGFDAAFKLAWDETYLYLLVDVNDATPMKNELPEPRIWDADGIELFIGSEQLDKDGALLFTDRQVLLAASSEAKSYYVNSEQPDKCKLAVVAKEGGYLLEAAIPWTALSCKPASNKEFLFDIAINDSFEGKRRDRQLVWNGTDRNSGDRTHWGRLRLIGQ